MQNYSARVSQLAAVVHLNQGLGPFRCKWTSWFIWFLARQQHPIPHLQGTQGIFFFNFSSCLVVGESEGKWTQKLWIFLFLLCVCAWQRKAMQALPQSLLQWGASQLSAYCMCVRACRVYEYTHAHKNTSAQGWAASIPFHTLKMQPGFGLSCTVQRRSPYIVLWVLRTLASPFLVTWVFQLPTQLELTSCCAASMVYPAVPVPFCPVCSHSTCERTWVSNPLVHVCTNHLNLLAVNFDGRFSLWDSVWLTEGSKEGNALLQGTGYWLRLARRSQSILISCQRVLLIALQFDVARQSYRSTERTLSIKLLSTHQQSFELLATGIPIGYDVSDLAWKRSRWQLVTTLKFMFQSSDKSLCEISSCQTKNE